MLGFLRLSILDSRLCAPVETIVEQDLRGFDDPIGKLEGGRITDSDGYAAMRWRQQRTLPCPPSPPFALKLNDSD